MIDEDHFRSALPVGVAKESNLLASRTDVHRNLVANLLEIPGDLSHRAIQRDDDENADSLSRLNICQSLNSLRQPARPGIRRILGCQMHDGDRIARFRSQWRCACSSSNTLGGSGQFPLRPLVDRPVFRYPSSTERSTSPRNPRASGAR